MKIDIKLAIITILIIINLIVGGYFIFLFFSIDTPDIYAEINISELTSEEIILDTLVDIKNSNPFDLNLKNIKIISETIEGDEFTNFSFKGGYVPSNNRKSFLSNESISFNGEIPKVLKNTITADIVVKFLGFIEKTISINAVVVVSVEDLINNISSPKIKITSGIDDITEDGLIFKADIDIINPSSIELSVDDMKVDLKTDDNVSVGSIKLDGGTLEPKGTLTLNVTGFLKFEALNANSIIIDLSGQATVKAAGIKQSLTLSTVSEINIPSLSELLGLENNSFDISLFAEFKVRFRGIITTIDFKIYNPSKIPLDLHDGRMIIFGIQGEKQKVIAEDDMETCTISPKEEYCTTSKIRIGYLKLLFSGTIFLPKWIGVRIEGRVAINGTDQSTPMSINAYVDPHIFI